MHAIVKGCEMPEMNRIFVSIHCYLAKWVTLTYTLQKKSGLKIKNGGGGACGIGKTETTFLKK